MGLKVFSVLFILVLCIIYFPYFDLKIVRRFILNRNRNVKCDFKNDLTPLFKACSEMRQAHRIFKEAIENERVEEIFLIS